LGASPVVLKGKAALQAFLISKNNTKPVQGNENSYPSCMPFLQIYLIKEKQIFLFIGFH
jgi:hypothetical protein